MNNNNDFSDLDTYSFKEEDEEEEEESFGSANTHTRKQNEEEILLRAIIANQKQLRGMIQILQQVQRDVYFEKKKDEKKHDRTCCFWFF